MRRMTTFFLLATTFLASPLWAQAAPAEEKQARWVLAYAFVFLLLGLSLWSVCRPSMRRRDG